MNWKADESPVIPRPVLEPWHPAMTTEEFAAAMARCCVSFGTSAETAHKIAALFAQVRDEMVEAREKRRSMNSERF